MSYDKILPPGQTEWSSQFTVSRATGAVTRKVDTKFGDKMRNAVDRSRGNVLDGITGQTTKTGDTVVGSWADAVSGTSVTVYQPKNFDAANPVYKMKIQDSEGNVTERDVNLKEVNPWKSDAFDMYAYSCYSSNSGRYDTALRDYMGTYAHYSKDMGGGTAYSDMFKQTDWLDAVNSLMNMQYGLGNMGGYMGYKGFYDFLSGGNFLGGGNMFW